MPGMAASRPVSASRMCAGPWLIAIAQPMTASVHDNIAVQSGEREAGMAAADPARVRPARPAKRAASGDLG
jgi:hypothetical protein